MGKRCFICFRSVFSTTKDYVSDHEKILLTVADLKPNFDREKKKGLAEALAPIYFQRLIAVIQKKSMSRCTSGFQGFTRRPKSKSIILYELTALLLLMPARS